MAGRRYAGKGPAVRLAAVATTSFRDACAQPGLALPTAPVADGHHDDTPAGAAPRISLLISRRRAIMEGRVRSVEIRPAAHGCILACTNRRKREITALFYGRRNIPGLAPRSHMRLRGTVSPGHPGAALVNPACELLR